MTLKDQLRAVREEFDMYLAEQISEGVIDGDDPKDVEEWVHRVGGRGLLDQERDLEISIKRGLLTDTGVAGEIREILVSRGHVRDTYTHNLSFETANWILEGRHECRFGFQVLEVLGKTIELSEDETCGLVQAYMRTWSSMAQKLAEEIFESEAAQEIASLREREIWAWQTAHELLGLGMAAFSFGENRTIVRNPRGVGVATIPLSEWTTQGVFDYFDGEEASPSELLAIQSLRECWVREEGACLSPFGTCLDRSDCGICHWQNTERREAAIKGVLEAPDSRTSIHKAYLRWSGTVGDVKVYNIIRYSNPIGRVWVPTKDPCPRCGQEHYPKEGCASR